METRETKIRDIAVYLFQNYPYPNDLSKARLVKMIYLADWRYSVLYGYQMTDIEWFYHNFGPYVPEIIDILLQDENFEKATVSNYYGSDKDLIRIKPNILLQLSLSKEEMEVLDYVIEVTSKLYWEDFIRVVYATYPIRNSEQYSTLDLVQFAKQYNSNVLERVI